MANISIPIPEDTENAIRALLEGIARDVITKTAEKEINAKQYLSMNETCEYIGISFGTLQRWIREEDFPIIHIQGKKFADKKTIHEFMKSHEK